MTKITMANSKTDKSVLVTGGSGFVGVHCILQLLDRTTLRSLNRKNEVIEMLKNGGVESVEHLSFIEANLSHDTNWDEAVKNY
jgi:dihydroflavonol-4-reductase